MNWIFHFLAAFCILYGCIPYGRCIAPDDSYVIEQSYIVVLEEDATDEEVDLHLETVRNLAITEGSISNITKEFTVGTVFRGYAAIFTDSLFDQVDEMDIVDYVESNQVVSTTFTPRCQTQCDAPWGIVRTTRMNTPIVDAYVYNPDTSGSGVKIYVLDTGIDTAHPDFGGRASFGVNFASDGSTGDPNGHGTHVAGIAMSTTYGVAKEATAISVRVLNAQGIGTLVSVILGIIWTIFQCCSPPFNLDGCNKCDETCIINMSLGGPNSEILDLITEIAVHIGVHVVVSAGNEEADACERSPAGAYDTITVAASDWDDSFASFSNFGTCVDIIAPGVDIISTYPGDTIATLSGTSTAKTYPGETTATLSGTSTASAHVAGVMAKYLSYYLFNAKTLPSPTQLREVLINTASTNKITGVPACTFNLLVFKECLTVPLWFT